MRGKMASVRVPTCARIFSRSAAFNLWPDRASPVEGTLSAATGMGLAILNRGCGVRWGA